MDIDFVLKHLLDENISGVVGFIVRRRMSFLVLRLQYKPKALTLPVLKIKARQKKERN